jgi:cellulose synthase/poly-beta-1,6-N-acetylglucosamine synthase-like glycosyltransferase
MLSFIVPAYNEERLLAATLAAIHAAAREIGIPYEIVVADDASTDGTGAIAAAAGARVVRAEHRQIAATRNSGARAALGDRFIFVDADTHVNAAVVHAAIAAMDSGAVGGGAEVRFAEPAPRWGHVTVRLVIGFMRLTGWAAGCFVYCTRAAFEAVGGFDERQFAAEEIVLSMALKRQGRFVILRETVETSPRKLTSRSFLATLWLTLRLLVRGPGGTRKREHTSFWYDGKR